MLAYSTTNTPEDGPILEIPLDHDYIVLKHSIVMVIGSIELERDAGGKVASTFPHPAPGTRPILPVDVTLSGLKGVALLRHSKLAKDKMGHASATTLIVHRP